MTERFLSRLGTAPDHRSVMAAFPEAISTTPRRDWDVLFRVDRDVTLVQSNIRPEWERLFERGVEVKRFTVPRPDVGTEWAFRVTVNPIKRRPKTEVIPASEWLATRQERLGAEFRGNRFVTCPVREQSHGNRVCLHLVTVTGTLTVTDPDLFHLSLLHGIGRGKAFGAGLLSIAPL